MAGSWSMLHLLVWSSLSSHTLHGMGSGQCRLAVVAPMQLHSTPPIGMAGTKVSGRSWWFSATLRADRGCRGVVQSSLSCTLRHDCGGDPGLRTSKGHPCALCPLSCSWAMLNAAECLVLPDRYNNQSVRIFIPIKSYHQVILFHHST